VTVLIRFGLIGCGSIAVKHIDSIAACPQAELVALADPATDRMELLARQYAQGRAVSRSPVALYANPRELLQDTRVDAVVIAVPSFMHAPWTMSALRAGKHVLLEKPIALSLRDADAIAELADRYRLRVQVCHQLRYRPLLRQAKQWIDRGALGTLRAGSVSILLNRSRDYFAASGWRGTWEKDGGMLLNQGVHLIDLLLWLMNDRVESVYGAIGWGGSALETEETAAAVIRFAGGAVGSVEATTLCRPNNLEQSLALIGDRGTIRIGGVRLTEVHRWHSDDFPAPQLPATEVNEHAAMYDHFTAAIGDSPSGGEADVLAGEARSSLEAAFAVYESARTNAPVSLPLASFDTSRMAGTKPNAQGERYR